MAEIFLTEGALASTNGVEQFFERAPVLVNQELELRPQHLTPGFKGILLVTSNGFEVGTLRAEGERILLGLLQGKKELKARVSTIRPIGHRYAIDLTVVLVDRRRDPP